MVVDTYQIILVEPDSKLGWGKVTFAGQLQDLEIEQLSQDERTLVVTVRQSRKKSSKQVLPRAYFLERAFISDIDIRRSHSISNGQTATDKRSPTSSSSQTPKDICCS